MLLRYLGFQKNKLSDGHKDLFSLLNNIYLQKLESYNYVLDIGIGILFK
jgi:hypothetical protein